MLFSDSEDESTTHVDERIMKLENALQDRDGLVEQLTRKLLSRDFDVRTKRGATLPRSENQNVIQLDSEENVFKDKEDYKNKQQYIQVIYGLKTRVSTLQSRMEQIKREHGQEVDALQERAEVLQEVLESRDQRILALEAIQLSTSKFAVGAVGDELESQNRQIMQLKNLLSESSKKPLTISREIQTGEKLEKMATCPTYTEAKLKEPILNIVNYASALGMNVSNKSEDPFTVEYVQKAIKHINKTLLERHRQLESLDSQITSQRDILGKLESQNETLKKKNNISTSKLDGLQVQMREYASTFDRLQEDLDWLVKLKEKRLRNLEGAIRLRESELDRMRYGETNEEQTEVGQDDNDEVSETLRRSLRVIKMAREQNVDNHALQGTDAFAGLANRDEEENRAPLQSIFHSTNICPEPESKSKSDPTTSTPKISPPRPTPKSLSSHQTPPPTTRPISAESLSKQWSTLLSTLNQTSKKFKTQEEDAKKGIKVLDRVMKDVHK